VILEVVLDGGAEDKGEEDETGERETHRPEPPLKRERGDPPPPLPSPSLSLSLSLSLSSFLSLLASSPSRLAIAAGQRRGGSLPCAF